MLGAILGDIVGSPYEFDHNNYKHKDFPLLSEKSHFTDDTVMTVAVARGLIAGKGIPERTFEETKSEMRICFYFNYSSSPAFSAVSTSFSSKFSSAEMVSSSAADSS